MQSVTLPARMRGQHPSTNGSNPWPQFTIGLAVMIPWPVIAALLQGLKDPVDYLIYLIGMFWTLLWDPVAKIYRAYWRAFTEGTITDDEWKPAGYRTIRTATSDDLVDWNS